MAGFSQSVRSGAQQETREQGDPQAHATVEKASTSPMTASGEQKQRGLRTRPEQHDEQNGDEDDRAPQGPAA